jgi:hypothetical protein
MDAHLFIQTPNPPCYYLTGASFLFRLWSAGDGQAKYMDKKKIQHTSLNNFYVVTRSVLSACFTGTATLFITSLSNNWMRVLSTLLLCYNSWFDDHRYKYEFF